MCHDSRFDCFVIRIFVLPVMWRKVMSRFFLCAASNMSFLTSAGISNTHKATFLLTCYLHCVDAMEENPG